MHLKRYQKRLRIITSSSSFTVLLVLILVIGFQFFGAFSKSATFGWIQSTWSGGADMVNFPNHTSNQTNWTKYYSKDETVSAGDTVSLSTSSGTATQTTDADFNAWTKTNGYVETGTGSITQLKAPGATCAEAAECASGICTSSVCRGKWLSGACSGIYVYATDLSTMYTWGPSSSCASPQCDATETYSGTAYNRLSFLNTVSYTDYPARNACKTVGGRLPTIAELSCIYTNRASYGNNFQTTRGYWSSTENSAGYAWNVNFGSGGVRFDPKNNKAYFIGYVRCVR